VAAKPILICRAHTTRGNRCPRGSVRRGPQSGVVAHNPAAALDDVGKAPRVSKYHVLEDLESDGRKALAFPAYSISL
jgi:hypothetical protein